MSTPKAAIMLAIFAFCTFFTRYIAFFAFPPGRKTPPYILYLGKVLPFAITSMLIVYCLKNISFFAAPYALPEFIAIAVVALIFLRLKNSLLAIAAGTVVYMVLVQSVFV